MASRLMSWCGWRLPPSTQSPRPAGYAHAHVGGTLDGPTPTPTISAPGYMSLLTGTWANTHNVWGNSPWSPDYANWSRFRIVEAADSWHVTDIVSTWHDNRADLVGKGRPGAGDVRIDHAVDGLERDMVTVPHDAAGARAAAGDERGNRAPCILSRRVRRGHPRPRCHRPRRRDARRGD